MPCVAVGIVVPVEVWFPDSVASCVKEAVSDGDGVAVGNVVTVAAVVAVVLPVGVVVQTDAWDV